MKYIVCGDPHCRPDNLDKIHKLLELIESYGLPTIFLGDMLDSRDIVRAQCLNTYINYFKNSKLDYVILCGNHDAINSEAKEFSLEPLKLLKNVTVVDKPYLLGDILFMPYYRNPGKFRAIIDQYKDAKYLFMHQDMVGMDWGNGHIATEGNNLIDISSFKAVYSGHYHKYQVKNNLTYIGTPFSHNFGESNQDKYLGLFDADTGGFSTLKTDFPKHITVHLDLNNPHLFDVNNLDHFRLIIKGTREQIDTFDASSYKGFKIIPEYVSEAHKLALKETQSPDDMFSRWFYDIKKETDPELHTLGLNILKDSK